MKRVLLLLIGFLLVCHAGYSQEKILFRGEEGEVQFLSEAPLETIAARSGNLRGAVDPQKLTFAFVVPIQSFEGFNSPLQQEHFNENYLESARWPNATFAGKIIEQIDLFTPGVYSVRAKGRLKIHGVEQERLLQVQIRSDGKEIEVDAKFPVLLQDHRITVPRIVNQKIAEEITVSISTTLQAKES